jgi:hypothetical protein
MGMERRNVVAEFLSDRGGRKATMDWQQWTKFPPFHRQCRCDECAPEDICL